MLVKMNVTIDASPDGLVIQHYEEGETYDVTARLGPMLVRGGLAKEVKADDGAPENKALPGPPANKGRGRGRPRKGVA